MVVFYARKVITLFAVLILVTFFSFLLVSFLPGKPENLLVPVQSTGTQKATIEGYKQEIRHDLHEDKPLLQRYGYWLNDFVHGDLGYYYLGIGNKRPVSESVKRAFPISLQLLVWSQVLALGIAIPLGVYAAHRAGRRADRITNGVLFAGLAIPNFALALVLVYFFGVKLRWTYVSDYHGIGQGIGPYVKSMIIPVISLAVAQIAVYQRLLRTDMIQTLREDFVLVAKAKGMSSKRVLWRHALRPSSLTLLTVAGLNVGTLIGGAIVIEVLFRLNGMGFLLGDAIGRRQYVAVQSLVALIAAVYVVVIFIIDILYSVLDPRIRNVRPAH